MILTKWRLIASFVALGVFLLLVKINASFFDAPLTRSSREFVHAVQELLEKDDRGSAEWYYWLSKFFEDAPLIDKEG